MAVSFGVVVVVVEEQCLLVFRGEQTGLLSSRESMRTRVQVVGVVEMLRGELSCGGGRFRFQLVELIRSEDLFLFRVTAE